MAEARARLTKPFAGAVIDWRGNKINIAVSGWRLGLNLEDAPHVIDESKDIAKHYLIDGLRGIW
jgi:hypothetical protein